MCSEIPPWSHPNLRHLLFYEPYLSRRPLLEVIKVVLIKELWCICFYQEMREEENGENWQLVHPYTLLRWAITHNWTVNSGIVFILQLSVIFVTITSLNCQLWGNGIASTSCNYVASTSTWSSFYILSLLGIDLYPAENLRGKV